MKPLKNSVALIIKDAAGRFLVIKRANDPGDRLANVWGFPAATYIDDEDELAAARRIGTQKLGVEIATGKRIGDGTHERQAYTLHLVDYEATIIDGIPSVPQADTSVSQYADYKFTTDPTILFEAARKGSQCTQIYLQSIGVDWS